MNEQQQRVSTKIKFNVFKKIICNTHRDKIIMNQNAIEEPDDSAESEEKRQ